MPDSTAPYHRTVLVILALIDFFFQSKYDKVTKQISEEYKHHKTNEQQRYKLQHFNLIGKEKAFCPKFWKDSKRAHGRTVMSGSSLQSTKAEKGVRIPIARRRASPAMRAVELGVERAHREVCSTVLKGG